MASWLVLLPYVVLFSVTDMLFKTYKKKIAASKYLFVEENPEIGDMIYNTAQDNRRTKDRNTDNLRNTVIF
jgi:hypothetical protein